MINEWWAGRRSMYPVGAGVIVLLSALLLGGAVIYQPGACAALAVLVLLLAFTIRHPHRISYLVLLSTALSVDYLYSGSLFGIEILSLYKLAILALLVPCILIYGISLKFIYPVLALFALLVITFFFSTWLPQLTASIAIKSFIGLSLPFVFLLIKWRKEVAERQMKIICLLPIVSVGVGAVLQLLHLHELLDVEFTGAVRLQGANIPPHLAMLSFLGTAVPFVELKRGGANPKFLYTVMAVNFGILIATGTRGPILALVFLALYYFYDLAREYLKGKVQLIIPLLGGMAVIIAAAALQWDNMKKRSFERSTDDAVDLSGRSEAWAYFLKQVDGHTLAGRGLGSVTVANDGTLFEGFVVPHNEYIRFYVDTGYTGAVLLFLSLFIIFWKIYKVLPSAVKPYYLGLILAFLIYSFSDNTLSTVQFIIPFCWYLNGLYRYSRPGSTDSS
ncbi:polysaccharide polymerase [Paenibacillus yonginensis]|uniref:Polysaccharide polymerase n=1 Tax=Paenibacillus yonginensis TaxID=1462996 RepID=A0A1B1MVW2_9BACL|nr:O-antigen ligase family protein [Paenibacillus yonginensis]ANS73295.1 polysaccharide polymerase [Paenibacillus yonginensis]